MATLRPEEQVKVVGLRELIKDLRAVDATLPKQLQQAGKAIAEEVAAATRAAATAQGGVAAKAAPAYRASATQREASIRIDAKKYPYAFGAEFGGGKYRVGRPTPGNRVGQGLRPGYTTQFRAWRGSSAGAGYALWPTIRRMRAEIERRYLGAIDAATAEAFPDGRG